jgi:hypothetical protein
MYFASLTGCGYFVTCIDDFSRKTRIYFMRTKHEAFSHLQEFNALVENVKGRKIKVIRSNNGGEYTRKDFKEFSA